MTKTSEELRPCPFCGARLERSEAFSRRTSDVYSHPETAEPCVLQSVVVSGPERMEAWNRRADKGEPVEWQRQNDGYGWIRVEPEDLEHYRAKGATLRALYALTAARLHEG